MMFKYRWLTVLFAVYVFAALGTARIAQSAEVKNVQIEPTIHIDVPVCFIALSKFLPHSPSPIPAFTPPTASAPKPEIQKSKTLFEHEAAQNAGKMPTLHYYAEYIPKLLPEFRTFGNWHN